METHIVLLIICLFFFGLFMYTDHSSTKERNLKNKRILEILATLNGGIVIVALGFAVIFALTM